MRANQRRGSLVAVALAGVLLASCSISAEDSPRDIPEEERRELDTGDVQAGSAQGETRVFLVAPSAPSDRNVLRAVLRDSPNDPASVVEELLRGPNDTEVRDELTTSLPSDLQLRSATRLGDTVVVDVSDELLNVSGDGSILAVGQIVATLAELDGVRSVRLTVEGEPQAWTDASGEPTTGLLSIYDFPGLVESSQPPIPGLP